MSASWWPGQVKARKLKQFYNQNTPIVIRRSDVEHVHDWARTHRSLRDYLFIRLPMQIGLRTSEIATLKIENINFEKRSFQVLDSKKKLLLPLFLDMITLQLIQDLIRDRKGGYVFRQRSWRYKKYDKPLTRTAVWHNISKIGKAAGVQPFYPRILRHYFAAKWHKDMKKPNSKKTIVGLQRMLRHTSLLTTTVYLAQLVFSEDLQEEYEDIQNNPIIQEKSIIKDKTKPILNDIYQKFCANCDHEPICKFINDFCSSDYAASCKYFLVKEQIIKKLTV